MSEIENSTKRTYQMQKVDPTFNSNVTSKRIIPNAWMKSILM